MAMMVVLIWDDWMESTVWMRSTTVPVLELFAPGIFTMSSSSSSYTVLDSSEDFAFTAILMRMALYSPVSFLWTTDLMSAP